MIDNLREAYNAESFRKEGHKLIDLLAGHLAKISNGEGKVLNWKTPDDQLKFWEEHIGSDHSLTDFFADVLDNSIAIHNPKYIGHQVGATAPVAALADLLGAMTNNGMAIYEMGAAGTAMEKFVTGILCRQVGFGDNADGFITSGGTLANLTALLAARKAMSERDVWQDGHKEKLGVMVSTEAHYCIDRSLRIMGFGEEGIIKVPVDEMFRVNTGSMEQYLRKAAEEGIKVIAFAASAPSTATGIYDDLVEIGQFCQNHNLWFHVDGAHGGAAIFSSKYRNLLNGIEIADSVVIDAHKMMMAPVLTTFLLFKNKVNSYATFHQKAKYLFDSQHDEEWYNYARRTFECTKLMMSLKFYSIIKAHGLRIFDEYVTRQYDLGSSFAEIICQHPEFELFIPPDSNIVCFRYIREGLSENGLSDLNARLRQQILENGDFYIVQTQLKGATWLRVSIMSPFTEVSTLSELLDYIVDLADHI